MNSIRMKEAYSVMDTHRGPTKSWGLGVTVAREGPLKEVTFQMRLDNFTVKIKGTHCTLLLQKAPLKPY